MMMVMIGHTIMIRSKMMKLLMLIRCTVTSLLKFWTNSTLNLNKMKSKSKKILIKNRLTMKQMTL